MNQLRTLALLIIVARVAAAQPSAPYDLLIRGGTVIDGTGAAGFRADVAVRGDRIVRVSRTPLSRAGATRVIDATNHVVSPGFIDLHAHLEPLLGLPGAESAVRQGVTTALGGPDGTSPLPLAPYMDSVTRTRVAINVGYLIGHNAIRRRVLGMADRAPDADELARMTQLVRQGMGDGAFGISTGLKYLPGTFAKTDEIVAMSRAASDSGGIYTSHLREEGLGLLDGVREAITIARDAHIPVVLTHHKAVGQPMWGASVKTLAMVDSARASGLDVVIDQYPYTASHTGIGVLIPSWAEAGGDSAFARRLAEKPLRDSIVKGIIDNIMNDRGGGDIARVQFALVSWDKSLEGKTLADWAVRRGLKPTPANGAELVIEAESKGGANAIFHVIDEADVARIMRHPQTMIASDGRLTALGDGHPHPRAYGTFPRVLGVYAREQRLLTMEQAVHKMTGMPAARLGLTSRGRVAEGMMADLVVFDPKTVRDAATYEKPHQYPVGIPYVVVNGALAVDGGKTTAARAGRVLRRQAR
jgi:dihydroorotase/N-acyl-D-amino-acid deacylase